MSSSLKRLVRFTALLVVMMPAVGVADKFVENELRCVVLLHGLLRSARSMYAMEQALRADGYAVVNQTYASRDWPVEILANNMMPALLQQCPDGSEIYFVTHSLGGILLRYYLQDQTIPGLMRAVMLGPPNQGSEAVDKLAELPGFYWLNGPAGLQLGTDENSVPNRIGEVNFELGVIAGDRSINWVLSALIPGKDDGKVAVSRTRVSGMKEHLVLPVTHPFMMRNREVIRQVKYFLNNGKFAKQE